MEGIALVLRSSSYLSKECPFNFPSIQGRLPFTLSTSPSKSKSIQVKMGIPILYQTDSDQVRLFNKSEMTNFPFNIFIISKPTPTGKSLFPSIDLESFRHSFEFRILPVVPNIVSKDSKPHKLGSRVLMKVKLS